MHLIPNSGGEDNRPLREFNDCHRPPGKGGGQFCAKGGAKGARVRQLPGFPKGDPDLPPHLIPDAKKAMAAGIVVHHRLSPDPVQDLMGVIHDPLATSHAKRQMDYWEDEKGFRHYARAGVHMTTRGGVWEPYEQIWNEWGPQGTRPKKLKPEDLKDPATPEDELATLRHEVGHIINNEGVREGKSTPETLAREITAWQYAIGMDPETEPSERMIRTGLLSHAYFEFAAKRINEERKASRFLAPLKLWWPDDHAMMTNAIRNEVERSGPHPETMKQAIAFTDRVVKALKKYRQVLRKKGITFTPKAPSPEFYPSQYVQSGPQGVGV